MDSIVNTALDEDESENREKIDEEEKENDETDNINEEITTNDEDVGVSDEELKEISRSIETNISVVGCGGGGGNTINRIVSEGIEGAELIAVNTDAQDLLDNKADHRLLIGQECCGGRGAGSIPMKGEEAALENRNEIESLLSDQDMVFVTAGMGGGTGTGAAPVVADIASDHALTIAVVTTPFSAEGIARKENAEGGLERLRQNADTVIVVPNDRLLDYAPGLPLQKAFKLCDEVLMRSVKGIAELITKPSLVNLDFADVQTIMEGGGVAMIGLGEASGIEKSDESVVTALESPLLDVNISSASNVLVNVMGGPDMQMEEAQGVVDHLNERVSDDSRIIWGAGVNEDLQDEIRTMIIITGVESPQIYAGDTTDTTDTTKSESIENDDEYVSPEPDTKKETDIEDIDYIVE